MISRVLRIHWHDKKPVFSMEFDPNDGSRLVTAGGDNNVRIWKWRPVAGEETMPEYCATLARHIRPVNCVRFSNSGELLASVSDGGAMIIWKRSNSPIAHSRAIFGGDDDEEADEGLDSGEYWSPLYTLRASDVEDCYDVAWSPDDRHIVVALTDNSAQIWDLSTQKCIRVLRDHQHFVQGVAWDPLGNYIVTASADRSVKIWQCSFKQNGTLIVTPGNKLIKLPGKSGDYPIFFDESLVSFFRRPSFSPDGSLLFLPCGLYQSQSQSPGGDGAVLTENCFYICAYSSLLSTPVLAIKGMEKPVLGIRCNPRLFALGESGTSSLFTLPYRIVYAIFTMDTVMVFDSNSITPISHIRDLHYGSLTDVCWSPDGMTLFVSSTDGFCSVLTLGSEELGVPLSPETQNEMLAGLKEKYSIKIPRKITAENQAIAAIQMQEDHFMAPSSDPVTTMDTMEVMEIPDTADEMNAGMDNLALEKTSIDALVTSTSVESTIQLNNITTAPTSDAKPSHQPPKRRIQPTLISNSCNL